RTVTGVQTCALPISRPGARRALRASGADGCGARAVRALRLALRTLAREWRSGELGVLLLALTVAVAALTGVGFLVSRISAAVALDRKSTRLNSSHRTISYAVFCLKKKTE